MTERDLQRVLSNSVQDVHLSDAARRRIRQETKEERPVTSKKFVAIVLAAMLMLSATVAVAAELGMFDFLARKMGQTVLPGANDLVHNDIAHGETDHVTYAIKQAVYDGKSVSLLVEMRAKDEETMLIGPAWMMEDRIGWYIYNTEAEALADSRTITDYAAEKGYTRFVEPSLSFIGYGWSSVDEWVDNTLTVLYSFPAEGDTIKIPFEYFACECSLSSACRTVLPSKPAQSHFGKSAATKALMPPTLVSVLTACPSSAPWCRATGRLTTPSLM